MAEMTFAFKLEDDGSLIVPREAVEKLGLHPGGDPGEALPADQAELQARFDRFFTRLDSLTFHRPADVTRSDPAEAEFAAAMDARMLNASTLKPSGLPDT